MRSDRRVTLLTAVATFVVLSALSAVVWAFTRPVESPSPPAVPMPAAAPVTEPFERISADELKPMIDAGQVVVIDVRSAEQFMAGHIDKALHIPVASIEGEIQYLPRNVLIVTYCTCPAEESSGEAALILQRRGLPARALLGGLGAWTAAGYPTVRGVK